MDSKEYRLRLGDTRTQLTTLLTQAVEKRDKQRAQLHELHALARDYSPEYFGKQLATIEAQIAASNAELGARARPILESWFRTMRARHEQPLDYSDPAISSVINLITVAGHQLEYQDLVSMVDQFRGYPAALRALKAVFEAQGLAQGVEMVDARTYEPEGVALAIQAAVDTAFLGNGSLNAISYEVSKVFEREGIEFPRMVDDAGVTEAMRAGAGLPPIPGA